MRDPKTEALAIHGFSMSLLNKNFDNAKPTPDFHKEMWEYCCDPNPRVAIAAPRGHAKSTAITHVYLMYCVLFRIHDHIMIVSDTEGQAAAFLADIKMELKENQKLIDLFGIKQDASWDRNTEKDVIVCCKDGYKFRIFVRGAETAMRGTKWRHKRPNLIICDDLENDEAVLTEERRIKLKTWFLNALMPALSDDGEVRIVGTILHFDSLLESLMPPLTGDGSEFTRVDGLKLYSENPDKLWKAIKYRAHTDFDDFSTFLWPERFSKDRLTKTRQDYIDAGNPEGYSQEYLNYPIAEMSAFFRKEDMPEMTEHDYKRKNNGQFRYYAAIDPAVSSKERRSYTAIVVCGEDSDGMLHVVDVVRERMDAKQIIDWMFAIQQAYSPDLFIVEDGVIKKSFGPFLEDEMNKPERPFINIHPMVPTKDKQTRARALQGRMRQKGVRFDKNAEWFGPFQEEMLRFPRGENDDQVDAISWIGLVLNELVPGITAREKEEEEWEEEYMETYEFDYSGRNSTTGY